LVEKKIIFVHHLLAEKNLSQDFVSQIFELDWTGESRTGDNFLMFFRTGRFFLGKQLDGRLNLGKKLDGRQNLGKNWTGDKIWGKNWTGVKFFWTARPFIRGGVVSPVIKYIFSQMGLLLDDQTNIQSEHQDYMIDRLYDSQRQERQWRNEVADQVMVTKGRFTDAVF